MNIALMTNNYKPFMGGVPISIERLAESLRLLGHSVTVFAPSYREQEEEENVFRYAALTQNFIGGIVLPNPMDHRIEREFRRKKFDLIHVHHPMLIGRTAVYLAKKYHIPLVFTYHTRYEQYLSYVKGISAMERWAGRDGLRGQCSEGCLHLVKDRLMPFYLKSFLKYCDLIFAPTEGMENYLRRTCGIPEEKLRVLPTGLKESQFLSDPDLKYRLRRQYGALDKTLFATVSRMSHEKNVEFLLSGLSVLKTEYAEDFKMLMVGDGPDRVYYERMSRELGLSENVIFVGEVPNRDINLYLGAADAFLFASRTETQGIVVLEAFAEAVPVLAVRASGVCDLVRSGYNGFLTDEDTGKYAAVLNAFIKGRYDRQTLRENALRTALKYREEAVAMRAVHYYNDIIQRECSVRRGFKPLPG